MSASQRRNPLPLPTGRGWWLVAAGLASGVLVFLALWLGQRDGAPPPDVQAPAAAAPSFRPLPAPPASGLADGADMPAPSGSGARIEEPAAAPPAADVPLAAGPAPAIDVLAGGGDSAPVAIESPSPRYPARALRRGESGEVLLRIHVDARGRPAQVDVASSSGSRDLDRAARTAARRWRFRPAMSGGNPVPGVVDVPITFDRQR